VVAWLWNDNEFWYIPALFVTLKLFTFSGMFLHLQLSSSGRLFLMLQRFPVESKGRRKKLQEALTFSEIIICNLFFVHIALLIVVGVSSWAGWLCDHHMFYMFPC
jgi:hypothetical protein